MADQKISVELAFRDLVVIGNSLNEVCNGLPLADFENRIGVPRGEALQLLDRVHALVDRIDPREKQAH
jgi:hypothetical protein